MFLDQSRQALVADGAGAFGGDHHRGGAGHADGVADLHQALGGQAGGHDVLGHVAGGVGGRPVDLGRILARKRAAAVRGCAAIGVDDDLAPGQAAIALRAADHEAAGRVDQVVDVALDQVLGQYRLDDLFDDGFAQGLVADVRRMLGRQHDGVDRVRLAVDVAQRDLRLGVRAQPGQAAVSAQVGLALDETVRVMDGGGHQDRGLVAGIAEHQALVAGTLLEVQAAAFIDALGDVLALLAVADLHRAALVIDAVFAVVVADAAQGFARDLAVVDIGAGGDLAGQQHETRGAQGLGGDARKLVLREDSVENRVRDLVGDFVRVALGHRFGSKKKFFGQNTSPFVQ